MGNYLIIRDTDACFSVCTISFGSGGIFTFLKQSSISHFGIVFSSSYVQVQILDHLVQILDASRCWCSLECGGMDPTKYLYHVFLINFWLDDLVPVWFIAFVSIQVLVEFCRLRLKVAVVPKFTFSPKPNIFSEASLK